MKYPLGIFVALISFSLSAQSPIAAVYSGHDAAPTKSKPTYNPERIGANGFKFETLHTGINSEYSDYGSGLFRGKFISLSARKVGAIAKKDPLTNEPFTRLYCSDITVDWDLTRPLRFSYLLNKNENLGTATFSEDGNTIYFTKNRKGHTANFHMFKAKMDPERPGKWTNITAMPFNSESYSVENPHLSQDGRILYFASDMPGSVGGFDIYQITVAEDGSFGKVSSVAGKINTAADEKFPHTSMDGKFLFFSSEGHDNIGGFDVFKSRRTKTGYNTIVNLGNTINTESNEIAFIPATDKIGYISTDREGGKGEYDIYRITEYAISQNVQGKAVNFETGIPLTDALVRLVDTDGTVVATALTNTSGEYHFPVTPFEYYTVVANKEGFYSGSVIFNTDNKTPLYNADISLNVVPAEIVVTEEKSYIKIDNIQFDYDSAAIKEISTITLNMVIKTMRENTNMKVSLRAHTDTQGSSAYNLKLSNRRAASVMKYLIDKGIHPERLVSKGYGELEPLVPCTKCTDEEHEINRRIEFVIL